MYTKQPEAIKVLYMDAYGAEREIEHKGPYFEINYGRCLVIKSSFNTIVPQAVYAPDVWRSVHAV